MISRYEMSELEMKMAKGKRFLPDIVWVTCNLYTTCVCVLPNIFHFLSPTAFWVAETVTDTPLWSGQGGTARPSDRPKTLRAAASANQRRALGRDYLEWPRID